MTTSRRHLSTLFILPLIWLVIACDSSPTEPPEEECMRTASDMDVGGVRTLHSFSAGDSPEGIAVDCAGNLYIGVRNGVTSRVDILRADGQQEVYAMLPDQGEGGTGVLGLLVDEDGLLYAAHGARNGVGGIYTITPDRQVNRIAGSEGMMLPNSVALSDDGTLYATDSFGPSTVFVPGGGCEVAGDCGFLWRLDEDGVMRQWLSHPVFDSYENPGAPITVPGPNGIAFYPPSTLYVANTSGGMVVAVDLLADGTGAPRVHAQNLGLLATLDGIAVDAGGVIYGVMASANAEELGAPPVPAVARVLTDGSVESMDADVAQFDTPTSLTFGAGARAGTSLFIVNAALFGPGTNGPGAGVVEMNTGAEGLIFNQ
ncbi:MAG: hypothetical protein HKN29_02260 [Rhodothermales bacterium]|nr:hypothetical protein [Rhodothermales bacterium]